jgi:hypothetical protein
MAVGEAHQIVLIGYSLPASDTFFQYLLGLGLQGNARLGRVVIVNPDTHDSFKERVGQVFSGRLKERGRVIFQEQDFASYVGGMMGQYGAMM